VSDEIPAASLPAGTVGCVGRTPGYTQLIKAYGMVLALRHRTVSPRGDRYVVDTEEAPVRGTRMSQVAVRVGPGRGRSGRLMIRRR